jgi:hypothetical protein
VRNYFRTLQTQFKNLPRPAQLSILVSALLIIAIIVSISNSRLAQEKTLSFTNAQQVVTPTWYCEGSCPTGSPTQPPSAFPSPTLFPGLSSSPSPNVTANPLSPQPTVPSACKPSPPPVSSNAYYVATTGDDTRTCEQATNISTPRKTINKGIECLKGGGDTLYIRGGTYDESLGDGASNNTNPPIPNGTSWTSAVKIAGYPGEKVMTTEGITMSSPASNADDPTATSYIIFDNLHIGYGLFFGVRSYIRFQNGEISLPPDNPGDINVVFNPGNYNLTSPLCKFS